MLVGWSFQIGRVNENTAPGARPALAPVLPRLAGLVAETGSVLAHLAILARESGVPTVVGFSGALEQFPPGTIVRVDGDTGTVEDEKEEETS